MRLRGRAALGTVLLLAAIACAGERTAAPALHAVLVSVDTLRPDHLGCYGYRRATSPGIDAFCRDAVVFENAIAHAPSTLPSHASLFSSLLPQHHGASVVRAAALPEGVLTLAEVLRGAGLRTLSWNGGAQVAAAFGLGQGFEVYESLAPADDLFENVVERAIRSLDRVAGQRFFWFLHSYEVHHPYDPLPRHLRRFDGAYAGPLPAVIDVGLLREINERRRVIDARDLAHIRAAYDAEIRSVDAAFDRLIHELRRRGLYDDTLVVLTSDHGEEFGEHGRVGWHAHTLFDELLRVPLVVKLPGQRHAGTRVGALVRGIDVAPTVLAALGLPVPEVFQGVDLLPLVAGGAAPPAVAVSLQDAPPGAASRAIRTASHKLYDGRLYDLAADPGEERDLADREPGLRASLEAALREATAAPPAHPAAPVRLDESTRDALQALGYVRP